METQQTPAIQVPLQEHLSPTEIAEAGRQTAAFLESTAFVYMKTAIRSYQGMLDGNLMSLPPSDGGAKYADLVGQLKGIARVEPILAGIVASGKQAEAQLREAEERGQG